MRNSLKRHVPRWMRRAFLLGGVALSLAMVGDPAVARTTAPFRPDSQSSTLVDTGRSGLTLAVHTVGLVHRSVESWSDGAFEALSLLALGLGLLGAGHVLGRKRETPAFHASDGVRGGPDEILTPHDARVTSIAQRAAR